MVVQHPSLHADAVGSGPRVALIHGFTQTRRCWGPIAEDLAEDHELILLDAPGHGRSGQVRADLVDGARQMVDLVGPAAYLGYSMGGRFALHAALDHPAEVRALVLVGATAGIESPDERSARVADDESRATRLEQIGLPAFLEEWLSLPLFSGLPAEDACRRERLENTPEGLASSLRLAGTGTQTPTWDRLAELSMPVLVVSGALDEKFTAIGRRLGESIGENAEVVTIADAGHTAHLEQPERFLSVVRPWLAAHAVDGDD